jgi:hypothetical protein
MATLLRAELWRLPGREQRKGKELQRLLQLCAGVAISCSSIGIALPVMRHKN